MTTNRVHTLTDAELQSALKIANQLRNDIIAEMARRVLIELGVTS